MLFGQFISSQNVGQEIDFYKSASQEKQPPQQNNINNLMKGFQRKLQGNTLNFDIEDGSIIIKHSDSGNLLINKFKLKNYPEGLHMFFQDLNELFEEFRVVSDDRLQFNKDGVLEYHMSTARRIVKVSINLERLPLSKQEQIEAQNKQLQEELERVRNILEERTKENLQCQQTIQALRLKVSELSVSKPLTNGHNHQQHMNGKEALVRDAPSNTYWQQPFGRKKRKDDEEDKPVQQYQKFNFEPDLQHPSYKFFDWNNNRLKYIKSGTEYTQITSSQPISQKGRTSIQVQILNRSFNPITIGLINKEKRYNLYDREQTQILCVSMVQECTSLKSQGGLCEVYKGIFKKNQPLNLLFNRDNKMFSLTINSRVVDFKVPEIAAATPLYLFVRMSSKGELLEFL